MSKEKLCWENAEFGFNISLHQRGRDNFKVVYGKQVKENLTYGQAARELGSCLMHAMSCEGRVDNREPGER